MTGGAHLRAYRFGVDSVFDGGLVGAVERLEAAPDAALLDALFVARDAATGELQAIDLAAARSDGTLSALLDFRLDLGRRRAMTRRTLATDAVSPALLETIVTRLEPGDALLVLLLDSASAPALDEAVARTRGRLVVDEPVTAVTLADVPAQIRVAL